MKPTHRLYLESIISSRYLISSFLILFFLLGNFQVTARDFANTRTPNRSSGEAPNDMIDGSIPLGALVLMEMQEGSLLMLPYADPNEVREIFEGSRRMSQDQAALNLLDLLLLYPRECLVPSSISVFDNSCKLIFRDYILNAAKIFFEAGLLNSKQTSNFIQINLLIWDEADRVEIENERANNVHGPFTDEEAPQENFNLAGDDETDDPTEALIQILPPSALCRYTYSYMDNNRLTTRSVDIPFKAFVDGEAHVVIRHPGGKCTVLYEKTKYAHFQLVKDSLKPLQKFPEGLPEDSPYRFTPSTFYFDSTFIRLTKGPHDVVVPKFTIARISTGMTYQRPVQQTLLCGGDDITTVESEQTAKTYEHYVTCYNRDGLLIQDGIGHRTILRDRQVFERIQTRPTCDNRRFKITSIYNPGPTAEEWTHRYKSEKPVELGCFVH